MQDATQRIELARTDGETKRLWISALVLASFVVPPISAQIFAKDSPAKAKPATKAAVTKIATTIGTETSLGSSKAGAKHPLVPALQIAKSSKESMAKVKDYSTVFIKRERIKEQLIQQSMDMKFRPEPFSVYLRFSEPHAGREVIYVEGLNKGNFLVHEDGLKALAGTLSFSPTSDEAMRENRYPLTKIGMANLLETVMTQWEAELKYGEVDVKFYANAKIGTQDCKLISATHPQARPQFKFHKTNLYIDKATNLPVRVEQYGFPTEGGEAPPLMEEYNYTSLKTNLGLTNRDFDPKNKDYDF